MSFFINGYFKHVYAYSLYTKQNTLFLFIYLLLSLSRILYTFKISFYKGLCYLSGLVIMLFVTQRFIKLIAIEKKEATS